MYRRKQPARSLKKTGTSFTAEFSLILSLITLFSLGPTRAGQDCNQCCQPYSSGCYGRYCSNGLGVCFVQGGCCQYSCLNKDLYTCSPYGGVLPPPEFFRMIQVSRANREFVEPTQLPAPQEDPQNVIEKHEVSPEPVVPTPKQPPVPSSLPQPRQNAGLQFQNSAQKARVQEPRQKLVPQTAAPQRIDRRRSDQVQELPKPLPTLEPQFSQKIAQSMPTNGVKTESIAGEIPPSGHPVQEQRRVASDNRPEGKSYYVVMGQTVAETDTNGGPPALPMSQDGLSGKQSAREASPPAKLFQTHRNDEQAAPRVVGQANISTARAAVRQEQEAPQPLLVGVHPIPVQVAAEQPPNQNRTTLVVRETTTDASENPRRQRSTGDITGCSCDAPPSVRTFLRVRAAPVSPGGEGKNRTSLRVIRIH